MEDHFSRTLKGKEDRHLRKILNSYMSLLKNKRIRIPTVLIVFAVLIFSFFTSTVLTRCLRDDNRSACVANSIKYDAHALAGGCYVSKIDQKGISNETRVLLVDAYVLNLANYSDDQIESVFDGVNSIWKDYGIQFNVNSINRIYNDSLKPITYRENKNEEKFLKFAENVANDGLYREQDTVIDVVFAEKLLTEFEIGFWKFHFWSFDLELSEGQGLRLNNTNLILFSTKSKNASWALAHEMAHLLGLLDKPEFRGEFNFMTHGGCVRDKYYPTVLSQEQVDTVVTTARSYEHKKEI